MGYFKNLLIAEQVEVGDRIPNPKPASSHQAYEHGITSRRWLRNLEQEHHEYHKAMLMIVGMISFSVGVLCGVVVGVFA